MGIKNIFTHLRFDKNYRKLSLKIKEKANQKEKVFREDPFYPILKTHKLSGKNKECWAFWIDYYYRVKFIFLSNEKVLFLDIGIHEIYK